MAHFVIIDKIDQPGKGQDFVCTERCSSKQLSIACLADGVSSSVGAGQGARLSASELLDIMLAKEDELIDLKFNYKEAYTIVAGNLDLLERASSANQAIQSDLSSFATTLITATVTSTFAQFSFVGNGGIFQIRKDWFELPVENMFLLGITNHLNPHVRFRDGDLPLFKTLKANRNSEGMNPDLIILGNDEIESSFFLICSDGLYSSEEVETLYNEESGDYFQRQNPRLTTFLKILKEHSNSIDSDPEAFKMAFRRALVEGELLVDDLSYALFIP